MDALSRQAALPSDHGSWVLLLVPLVLGLALGGTPTRASGWLVLAAVAGFLLRQPLTLAARIVGGRRPSRDWRAVALWGGVWGVPAAVAAAALAVGGRAALLALALPGAMVLAVHLWLVTRRADRRRPLVELAGAGALTLVGPAALWCGAAGGVIGGRTGWILWLAVWLQAAASLLHVHALLVRRGGAGGGSAHAAAAGLGLAAPLLTAVLCLFGGISPWVGAAALPQAIENLRGPWRPVRGVRPARIGVRQAVLTGIFAALCLALWRGA